MYCGQAAEYAPNENLTRSVNCSRGDDRHLGAVHAEIRVISPYGEHVYSSDPRSGGQLLDDEALQQRNERAEMLRLRRQQEEDQRDLLSSEEVQD
jgi:hypothetical protein